MIARTWSGEVRLDRSDEYLELMRTVALPAYAETPGNRGAWTLRRDLEDRTQFTMLTFWESEDAIAAFAGNDISVAKYYDFDPEMLIEMVPNADHFELYDS